MTDITEHEWTGDETGGTVLSGVSDKGTLEFLYCYSIDKSDAIAIANHFGLIEDKETFTTDGGRL